MFKTEKVNCMTRVKKPLIGSFFMNTLKASYQMTKLKLFLRPINIQVNKTETDKNTCII